jgi:hypothetical protein
MFGCVKPSQDALIVNQPCHVLLSNRQCMLLLLLQGVGSHAAHLLLRSGVGRLRLVDFDQVTLSSLNRHALATRADVGIPKATCLQRHFQQIMPEVNVLQEPKNHHQQPPPFPQQSSISVTSSCAIWVCMGMLQQQLMHNQHALLKQPCTYLIIQTTPCSSQKQQRIPGLTGLSLALWLHDRFSCG